MISWPLSPKPFPEVRGGLPQITIIILHKSFSGRSVIDAAWRLTTFGIGSPVAMVLVRVGWRLYEIAPLSSKANRSRPWSECEFDQRFQLVTIVLEVNEGTIGELRRDEENVRGVETNSQTLRHRLSVRPDLMKIKSRPTDKQRQVDRARLNSR